MPDHAKSTRRSVAHLDICHQGRDVRDDVEDGRAASLSSHDSREEDRGSIPKIINWEESDHQQYPPWWAVLTYLLWRKGWLRSIVVAILVVNLLMSCNKNTTTNRDKEAEILEIYHAKAKDLRDANLCRSFRHHQKFFSVRSSVLSWVKTKEGQQHLLYRSGKYYFGFIVNEDYAFRHIYKSGGTTVAVQTGQKHVRQPDVGNRSLLTTVRDPLERFLSGWAECGGRNFNAMMALTKSDVYDDRVYAWLQFLKTGKHRTRKSPKMLKSCKEHSHPQATSFW